MAEGKKPDAAEWAERFKKYGCVTKELVPSSARLSRYIGEEHPERYASYENLLADFQRQTLRWAAEAMRDWVYRGNPAEELPQFVERLAEGKQS